MAASTLMPNRPLPNRKAKSTTRQQMNGSTNPLQLPAEELEKQKNKKLVKKGSTYAAPPAPNPTQGNLRKGSTRMGGY